MNDGETADPRNFGTNPLVKRWAEEAEQVRLADDAFYEAVQNATMAVMDDFDYLGLPEDDQLSGLMIAVNDALSAIFEEYR